MGRSQWTCTIFNYLEFFMILQSRRFRFTNFFSALIFARTYTSISTTMPLSFKTNSYPIPGLHNLLVGQPLPAFALAPQGPTMIQGVGWSLPAGAYTARQIVVGCAPLLETVLHNLGPDVEGQSTAREMLLDNLASNLDLGTRESSLEIPPKDPGRKEMAEQAVKIGKYIVAYARETRYVAFDPNYVIRSPCEGHLLKPQVAQLMFGPRSLRHLMQIYNEYLHQMVLLRDALLPFENHDEVVIPIVPGPGKGHLGMRFTETQRMGFIAELMTKSITQASVFKVVQSLLVPSMSTDNAYGFQYKHGLILPDAVIGGLSLRLFRYIPVVFDETTTDVKLVYELEDYYSAPLLDIRPAKHSVEKGNPIGIAIDAQEHAVKDCCLSLSSATPDLESRHLQLRINRKDGTSSSTDVGQIARGWRYSYKVSPAEEESVIDHFSSTASLHTAVDVLSQSGQSGLVTAKEGGMHVIQTSSQIEILALLGQIYPDNIIMLEKGASLKDAEEAGQSMPGEPCFVLQLLDS
ncbi:hypothetical protein D6D01_03954 [Aureobasidium pullulans]|uniref:Uncharacterized protein n=1 Tax=Aureobasidium pullulans TaxID=5580 RepID=A0A4S9LFP0_AURPU|nr:hypothetical protein D6D01_03954 [Aureobasidium pullulans]